MKALIAVSLSREWVEADFLMQMGKWYMPEGWQFKFGWFRQFTAAHRHNTAMYEGIYNYDRVIFMDTDQIYPTDYLTKLLAHEEEVVTGLTVARYTPFEHTIYKIIGEEIVEGTPIPIIETIRPPMDRTMIECDLTGTAALAIKPTVLESIEQPYFKDLWDKSRTNRLLCDDFYFIWQLHKAGIKIHVDQDIIVNHIAKVLVSPYNRIDIQNGWEKLQGGHGYAKDGRPA